MDNNRIDLSHMAAKWPSSIVTRRDFGKFSGGAVSPGTVANADHKGIGPRGRFRIGQKTAYTVEAAIRWLEARATNARLSRVGG